MTTPARRLIEDLFPLCRSITGSGVRATLDRIAEEIDLDWSSLASGTQVFDWTVPDEWNIRDAYVTRAGSDERIIDFRRSNLHVVGYSEPIDRVMSLEELRPHLHSLPDRPTLVPYRTSYYQRTWGFCLSHDRLESLEDVDYHVVIDSTLAPGRLDWAEHVALVEPLVWLAEAERRAGQGDEARLHVERALALGGAQGLEAWELAYAHLVLARVALARGETARARVEGEAARSGYATLSASRRRLVGSELAELEAWWDEHGER